jgi:MFS family permease
LKYEGRGVAHANSGIDASSAPENVYDTNMITKDSGHKNSRLKALHLGLLFAVLYFVQGLAEPGEGLIAQPVRSLLNGWNKSPSEITQFMAIVSVPWAIKPLYGLLIDFVPLFGSRRRKYLLLATLATAVSLLWLAIRMPAEGETSQLLALLTVPTLAVAFSDVVADALMVEKGQPLGLTGRLQSIQWGSMYAATILAGSLGGWMSEHSRYELGFLICGLGALVTFVATWIWIHDASVPESTALNSLRSEAADQAAASAVPQETLRSRLGIMGRTLMSRQFLFIAVFLFLWNFNPFSSTIQQLHMTEQVKLTPQEYGHSYSLFSIGAIGACLVYGFLCRIIPGRWLIHLAIAAGVLSTLAYLLVEGVQSAFVVSVFVGFVYMLGNLIQLDLAARMCPPTIAGSMFAMLMSVSNLAIIASTVLGGTLYEIFTKQGGPEFAWTFVVLIGSATTAMCWCLVPWFQGDCQSH